MRGHVTLCYMVVGGNLNSPLNLFISFAKALMEQGFRSDLFLAKDSRFGTGEAPGHLWRYLGDRIQRKRSPGLCRRCDVSIRKRAAGQVRRRQVHR